MNDVLGPGAVVLLVAGLAAPTSLGCGDDDPNPVNHSAGGTAGEGGLGGAGAAGGIATGAQGGAGAGNGGGGEGGAPPNCDGALVEAFGDFSGALAVDSAGNVFAGATLADGTQTAHAFAAADIEAGGAAIGTEVLALDGFGGPMAALAPDASGQGWLVYQPTDGNTFLPLDPVGVRYDASGGSVIAVDAVAPVVSLAVPGTAVSLMADDLDRLWIGMPRIGGGTTFIVLERDDAACLTPGGLSSYLTLGTGLCLADWYNAPTFELTALAFTAVEPTWGRHGGPLAWRPGSVAGTIDLLRFDTPAVGDMTITPTTFDPALTGDAEVDHFLGARVVDVPGTATTLFSYTALDSTGELLLVEGSTVVDRRHAVGVFTLDAVGGSAPQTLYTGLSVVGSDTPESNGLYTAPLCAP